MCAEQSAKMFPGFDIIKSLIFVLYVVVCWAYLSIVSPPKEINLLIVRVSVVVFLICVTLSIISIAYAWRIKEKGISYFAPIKILAPKILIDLAVMLFFTVICLWIIAFGGILKSPVAGLLTISPIFIAMQLIGRRDLALSVEEFSHFVNTSNPTEQIEVYNAKIQRWLGFSIISNSLLSVLIIVASITYFEWDIKDGILDLISLPNSIFITDNNVFKTEWFFMTCYSVYYLSIVSVFVGFFSKRLEPVTDRAFF